MFCPTVTLKQGLPRRASLSVNAACEVVQGIKGEGSGQRGERQNEEIGGDGGREKEEVLR